MKVIYWTDEHKLQTQYDFLEQNTEYALCFHQANNVSPYSELDGKPFSVIEDRDYTPLEIYQHWVVHTATVVMSSETLRTLAFKETLNDPTLQYLDTIIGNFYQGKIKQHSDWQIFIRSYNNFFQTLKQGQFATAFQFLKWILKHYKKLIIYLLKKVKREM